MDVETLSFSITIVVRPTSDNQKAIKTLNLHHINILETRVQSFVTRESMKSRCRPAHGKTKHSKTFSNKKQVDVGTNESVKHAIIGLKAITATG